jgi:recombination protein RecA
MAMPKDLQDTLKAINKKYGAGTITTGNKALAVKLKRIPTGSFSLDCELGGGYPEGRITIIAGQFSSGKTYLAYHGIAQAQKKYPNKIAIFIDQEGTFDADWAENFGIDLERLEIVRPATAEHGFDIMTALMQSSHISMIVLDSLAAMTSSKEIEKSMEDSQAMGGNAKMNNEFFRKAQGILNMGSIEEEKEQPAIIIINQLRDTMDKYKPEIMVGGRGQEYASSITIWVRIGDRFIEKKSDGREIYVGHMVKFKTEKNKTFSPKRQGTFDIYVDTANSGFKAGEIDRLKEVVTYAIYWGVVGKAGSWFTILGNEEWKFQGATKVLDFLRNNPDVREEVEKQVMTIALTTKKGDINQEEQLVYETENGVSIDPETGEIIEEE